MSRRSDPRELTFPQERPTSVHNIIQGFETRIRRLEEDVRKAVILANESKQASEDFQRIVTSSVDTQFKHIRGELSKLEVGTTEQNVTLDKQNITLDKQNATLDTQTEQLRTLDAKLDNVIRAVEQREHIEKAEKVVLDKYDARIKRVQATAAVLAIAFAVVSWFVTHWPFHK